MSNLVLQSHNKGDLGVHFAKALLKRAKTDAIDIQTAGGLINGRFYGPNADESYVLCEINASSTFAFPEHAMPGVAQAALARLAGIRRVE